MKNTDRRSRGDHGDTLVEVLLALIIMGLSAVALIVAFQTSISASGEHRNLSAVTTAIADVTSSAYSEVRVLDASPGTNFFAAPQQPLAFYTQNFDPVLDARLPSGFTADVTLVQYWDAASQTFDANFTAYQPQLITVRITNTVTGKYTDHGVILVDPTQVAPVSYGTTPVQLAFAVEPSGATLSTNFSTQPSVVVEDASGNIVPSALPYITITISDATDGNGANLSSSCSASGNGTGVFVYNNCSIDTLGTGYELEVDAPGLTSGYSTAFNVTSVPLTVPSITSVSPSVTTAGALVVNFTGSSNAPSGQNYVATACTDAQMSQNCQSGSNFSSGGTLSGLVQGTSYYVQLQAAASTGYIAATSPTFGPTGSSVQLNAPTNVVASYGTTAGSLTVNFTGSSNAPVGVTYSAEACTTSNMLSNCVTNPSITSGGHITGLNYSAGSAGTSYYVTVTANSVSGYLASVASSISASQRDTSILNVPTNLILVSSTSTAGSITASFTAPSGAAPTSYSAEACTDLPMTQNCVTQATYASGSQFTGLTPGTSYYVMVTANAPSGFLSSDIESVGTILATSQLTTPTGVTLAYGTTAGSLTVNFTGSSNAPGGQTYGAKACTNNTMTTGCVTTASITSGGQFTGLVYSAGSAGTPYFVTVSANASSGYLASPASTVTATSQPAASQFNTPTLVAPSYGPNAGSITVTFSTPTGTAPTSYSAKACTDTAMTVGCVTNTSITSGGQITGLVYVAGSVGSGGTSYYVTVSANASGGFLASAPSSRSGLQSDTSILNVPTNLNLASSTTAAGSITATFAAPSGAVPTSYTAEACTDLPMTQNCVAQATYASGSQFTGLTPGTSYYVMITANAPSGYVNSSVESAGTILATSQLVAPTGVTLAYGTTAGSLTVTFTGSTGTAPTSYSATACTNNTMTTGCVTNPSIVSGGQITGLAYTAGLAGTSYFVTVSANASSGYLASPASLVSASHADTSILNVPTVLTLASSTTTAGSITASFTAPLGTAPSSYTAKACTDLPMTQNCVAQATYASGSQFTGLTPGTSYYVMITANAPSGYVNSSVESAGTILATSQLVAPTGVTLAYGTTAGSLTVNFVGSSNAPGGQTYSAKACTNNTMTTGCVTNPSIVSGGQITGLVYSAGSAGTSYFVTVSANASSGYLASPASTVSASQAAISIFVAPTGVTLAYGTTAGSLTVTFTGSTGTAPTSYSATACTNNTMTTGCVTNPSIVSGGQITGLAYTAGLAGTSYFVTVSANASSGYLASPASLVSASHADTSILNVPTVLTLASSTTTAGSITASFTAPLGTAPSSYTAKACTDLPMTQNCVAQATYASGSQFTGLTPGTSYYVMITANAPSGYVNSSVESAGTILATSQLVAPTGVTLAYGTTAGSLTVNFVGSSNAPGGQTYSAKACTNNTMTTGCVTNPSIVSGGQITGLVYSAGSAGTSYFVTVSANASSGYLASPASTVSASQAAISIFVAPTGVTLAYGTTAGSLTVTFTGSTGTAPTSYSATACTNNTMTTGCVTNPSIVSGGQITGLAYTAGLAGTSYFVTVSANASSGYLASPASLVSASHADTSILNVPTALALTHINNSSIRANFSAPTGTAPSSYTALVCPNAGLTGCLAPITGYASGNTISGVVNTSTYYVQITAIGPTGYLNSVVSTGPVTG